MDLQRIQTALRERKIGGWLLCDFHHRDHLAYRVLGLSMERMTTRRWFYYVPARGTPKKLVHSVERGKLDTLPGSTHVYLSWEELHASLRKLLGPKKQIAMQYSPKNNIPAISLVDAGTVELIRSFGHKVVSSADLVQLFEAVIDEQGYASHCEAGAIVDRIRAEAFAKISEGVRIGNGVSELEITRYIMNRFTQEGLTTADAPIVGSNEHPADPHFESTPENNRPFKQGDTVLIDLWAKKNVPGAIYYDITWVGFIGETPPAKYKEIFDTVVRARDVAFALVQEKFARKQPCFGWQLDEAARNVIKKAGYGKYFVHRTGHSIGEETHGNGGNIDNLETRDDRLLMPGCCFSIEPGIYLEGSMAARSEINVFIRHDGVPVVTGEVQKELVKL